MEGAPQGSSSHGLVWGSRAAAAHHRVSCLCWLCRWPFEQDVEQGNTDGLGDCQSKQGPLPSHSSIPHRSLHSLFLPPVYLGSALTLSFSCRNTLNTRTCFTHTDTHTSLTEAFIVTYSLSYTKPYRSLFSVDCIHLLHHFICCE